MFFRNCHIYDKNKHVSWSSDIFRNASFSEQHNNSAEKIVVSRDFIRVYFCFCMYIYVYISRPPYKKEIKNANGRNRELILLMLGHSTLIHLYKVHDSSSQ